jgi:tubulin monoglycylase TTLL3/8
VDPAKEKLQKKKAEQRGDTPEKKQDAKAQDLQLAQFIKRNVPKNKVILNITDMKEWKKRNKVADETKVFIVKGGYGDIKRALKARGWVENKDKNSVCFDLKYTLKTSDIDFDHLLPGQIVNHYGKTTSITRKVGLTHSLKNLIWFNNVDVDTFYPRCFDLGLQEEMDDFIMDFKATKAQNYLKIYLREIREAFDSGEALQS